MTTYPTEDDYDVAVEQGRWGFQAVCSCKWKGPPYLHKRDADASALNHVLDHSIRVDPSAHGYERGAKMKAPPPPTIEQLARSLGMSVEQLREMGRRYRAMCLRSPA